MAMMARPSGNFASSLVAMTTPTPFERMGSPISTPGR
jgi:hypothetical protein